MRAMVVTAYDAPLEARDLSAPALARGHALLEVLTCGVCFSDVKIARGKMPFSAGLALPHVPGHEICARVLETGRAGAATAAGRARRTSAAHPRCAPVSPSRAGSWSAWSPRSTA